MKFLFLGVADQTLAKADLGLRKAKNNSSFSRPLVMIEMRVQSGSYGYLWRVRCNSFLVLS